MAPMVRNGNLIICNSVESTMVRNSSFMKKMFEILEEAGNKMINISNKEEKEEERIKILIVGGYKNDLSSYNKYQSITYGQINENYLGPLEDEEYIYANMGSFDYTNYIISSEEGLNLQTLNSFHPSVRYNDPRKSVVELEKEYIDDKVKKIIQSIYFEKNRKILDLTNAHKVIFNEDWFIMVDSKHNITSAIVGNDPRAVIEYEEYLTLTQEYSSHYDSEGHVKDEAKYKFRR